MRKFLLALSLTIATPVLAGPVGTAMEDGATLLAANALCDAGFNEIDLSERVAVSSEETGIRNLLFVRQKMAELSQKYIETMMRDGLVKQFCTNIDEFRMKSLKVQPTLKTY